MDKSFAKAMIGVIRAERDRRIELAAKDQERGWSADDETFTFTNELCLMLLVTIRHQVERDLVLFAVRTASQGREVDDAEYGKSVKKEKNKLKSKEAWEKLYTSLELEDERYWLETLRLLSNQYKHDPYPDEAMLEHLCLDTKTSYGALPESQAFREGLAKSLELTIDADYCDIAEAFLNRAAGCLKRLGERLGYKFYAVGTDNFSV